MGETDKDRKKGKKPPGKVFLWWVPVLKQNRRKGSTPSGEENEKGETSEKKRMPQKGKREKSFARFKRKTLEREGGKQGKRTNGKKHS